MIYFSRLKEKYFPRICRTNNFYITKEEKRRYISNFKKFVDKFRLVAMGTTFDPREKFGFNEFYEIYYNLFWESPKEDFYIFRKRCEEGCYRLKFDHWKLFKQKNGKLLLSSCPYGDESEVLETKGVSYAQKSKNLEFEFCNDLKFMKNGSLMFVVYQI